MELSEQFFPPDFPPRFIDVGGGFASRLPPLLERQLGRLPSFTEYATVIGEAAAAQYPNAEPELIIEPGMALVADVMQFVCRVTDISNIGTKVFIQTTGSMYNIKPSGHNVVLPCAVVRVHGSSPCKPWTLGGKAVGYTCQEDDVLFEELAGPVGVGDYLVVDNVGAYTTSMFPPFIRELPPVLRRKAIDEGEIDGC